MQACGPHPSRSGFVPGGCLAKPTHKAGSAWNAPAHWPSKLPTWGRKPVGCVWLHVRGVVAGLRGP
eukprot:10647156-Alexandrium_andersonii.AAC.1